MLSRSAQGLYWMGRYLERAEQLSRQMRLQVEALVDRPIREINFGWSRIYVTIGCEPPVGGLEFGDGDDYVLADSYTLADHLTFERANPASIWSSLSLGRENARQMRHCISSEMWTCLNLAYLRIRDLSVSDIWKVSPETFYSETAREIDTFIGVAEATMYRDEGWHFMRLGQFIERSQLMIASLLAQFMLERRYGEVQDEDWAVLLQMYQAREAYVATHGVEIRPDAVIDFLVTDARLARSLKYSIESSAAGLVEISAASGSRIDGDLRQFAARLAQRIDEEWPGKDNREDLLTQAREDCLRLHDLVMSTYVDYDLETVAPN